MQNGRFSHFNDAELKSLRYCLEVGISEIDWECKDSGLETIILDEVYDELGHRYNTSQLDEQFYSGEGREN